VGKTYLWASPILLFMLFTGITVCGLRNYNSPGTGCIPDDAAFEQISYEITTSHLKSGCAENAIVNGFLHLIEQR
jgi:hypothetical protein